MSRVAAALGKNTTSLFSPGRSRGLGEKTVFPADAVKQQNLKHVLIYDAHSEQVQ
jgi:hypothetical protein